jgi:hypothetical protein
MNKLNIQIANEIRDNYNNYKQNEAPIIEPINYPISLSEVRPQLINWLIFLCDNLNFSIQTLYRSVIIFDQYISKKKNVIFTQEKLKLITIASLSLGTKLEEINCNYTSFFTEKVLNSPQCEIYKKSDLTKMEFDILKTLNFKTLYSSAVDFSLVYLEIFKLYCNRNYFLCENFRQVNEAHLKNYLLNDMFITMSQSEIAYLVFVNSFNYMGINTIILKNIETIVLGSFIENSENKKFINNMNNHFLALSSL